MRRLNPLGGIIEGFRDAIFGRPFNWSGLGASAAVTWLITSIWIFRRMEQELADVI
jgi:ABC-type polysaccharide/polyol phosphate export permease